MDPRLKAFERLLNIMDDLREQCPWDQKQTLESLRNLTIEETYELADAITKNDLQELKGEIGDLLLHMVFYCKIATEQKAFTITDALNTVCEKLIHRHPHIYGDVKVANEEEVKANWEKLKLKEGKNLCFQESHLPYLHWLKQQESKRKVKGIGFEWEHAEDVWKKVKEELKEFEYEVSKNSKAQEEEFGDLLFSLVNYARFVNISPESALSKTNLKFITRFQLMENMILEEGHSIDKMSLKDMDAFWERAKISLKKDSAS